MTDNPTTAPELLAGTSFSELVSSDSLASCSFVLNYGNSLPVQFQVILCRRIVQHGGVFVV